jgi:MFS family permease
VASLYCGLVDDIFSPIALRALQAAGGAGFTPSATGIIVDRYGIDRHRDPRRFPMIPAARKPGSSSWWGCCSLLLVAALPLIRRVPDQRGAW